MKLTRRQLNLLKHLAAYRILSCDQAAVLQDVGRQAARKRLRKLMDFGLVDRQPHGFGRSRSHPARTYCLSREGIAYLESLGLDLGRDWGASSEGTTAPDHQLLLN